MNLIYQDLRLKHLFIKEASSFKMFLSSSNCAGARGHLGMQLNYKLICNQIHH